MQGGRMLDRDNTSNSGDWSGLVSGFVTMKKLSTRDKDSKLRSSKGNGFGTTLLWSLFDAGTLIWCCTALSDHKMELELVPSHVVAFYGDKTQRFDRQEIWSCSDVSFLSHNSWHPVGFSADTQHEEREENKLSPLGGPKLPEEVHGAPPDSFVAQLAEIMAGIKTEQLMAEFWLEVIKEVCAFLWKEVWWVTLASAWCTYIQMLSAMSLSPQDDPSRNCGPSIIVLIDLWIWSTLNAALASLVGRATNFSNASWCKPWTLLLSVAPTIATYKLLHC